MNTIQREHSHQMSQGELNPFVPTSRRTTPAWNLAAGLLWIIAALATVVALEMSTGFRMVRDIPQIVLISPFLFGINNVVWGFTALGRALRRTSIPSILDVDLSSSALRPPPFTGRMAAVAYWGFIGIVAWAAGSFAGRHALIAMKDLEFFAAVMTVLGIAFLLAVSRDRELARNQIAALDCFIPTPHDVAVLIPAYNEETGIIATIASAAELVGLDQIYVVSDGSTDRTVELARTTGANVWDKQPNAGKAKGIAGSLEHFDLLNRYEFVMIVDSDSMLDPDYLRNGLPLLADPEYVALAGYAISTWNPKDLSVLGRIITTHRSRVYEMTQITMKYGQAGKWFNVVPIVPGFASVYRTSALREINITAPGLVIEDFNMTFELHHKRLGKIAFTTGAIGYTQDPDSLGDYVRQIGRWNLGLFQTLRHHGLWWSWFSVALVLFLIETVVAALALIVGVPTALALLILEFVPGMLDVPVLSGLHDALTSRGPLLGLVGAIVLPDFLLTCFVAARLRRPAALLYGLASIPMRLVDSIVLLRTIPKTFTEKSDGRWKSPTRRLETTST